MQVRIDVVQGDITGLGVEAIVNAANPGLLGGGGVDGAIHRAAGSGLLAECRALPQSSPGVRCPPGEARITGGHGLRAGHVIHTVGPVWRDGTHGEPAQLAACYRNSLELAERHGLGSIAFPAISCGIYGYPLEQAVAVAVREVRAWLSEHEAPGRVVFCCFSPAAAAAYRAALSL